MGDNGEHMQSRRFRTSTLSNRYDFEARYNSCIYYYFAYFVCILLCFSALFPLSVGAFGQPYSLTSFGLCAGFFERLGNVCVDAEGRL